MNRHARTILTMIALLVLASAAAAAGVPGTVLTRHLLPLQAPTGLAWDGHRLWVADLERATLSAVDPATGEVTATIDAPGYQPQDLAWDGALLWVVDALDKTVYALDPTTGVISRALPTDTDAVKGLEWDGAALWTVDAAAGLVSRLDQKDGTTFQSFPSPRAKARSDELGLAFDGTYLWVSDRFADRIYRVDVATGAVLDSFPSPGPYPAGLAWDGARLWSVDYETRELCALETVSGSPYVIDEPKHETLVYREEWRNFGPGVVKTLDVYIAVPHDLPSQKLAGEPAFTPAPTDFVADRWGQRCAHFAFTDIAPGESVTATMNVEATLYEVRWYVDPAKVGKLDAIPADIRKTYTQDSSKLVVTDPVIQDAVKAALGGETNPYWMARKINRHIQEHMYYELVGGWNVAPTVLARGSGSCSEYSFVMLAMCHAAGLPARYAGSVVIRNDDASRDDVFHRWVEVYLPGYGWFPIDPSGGDSETPSTVADYFGGLASRFLITTLGAGDSETLGWDYNSFATWTAQGRVKVMQQKAGSWVPVGKTYEPALTAEAGEVPAR